MTASLDDLLAAVRSKFPKDEGRLYGHESGNRIADLDSYLFDTPHGKWNDTTDLKPPPNHSHHFPGMIRQMIGEASHWVDILTMDEPRGTFLDAIVGGIGDALTKNRQPTVRFLIGSSVPNGNLRTDIMLGKAADSLKRRGGAKPELYLAQFRFMEAKSWNHAKIIAVDGRTMMNGGHNLWSEAYLGERPIFDMSMRIDGPITKGGHLFANGLWKFVADNNRHGSRTYCNSLQPETGYTVGTKAPRALWAPQAEPPPPPGRQPALWVTNPGWGVFENNIAFAASSGYFAFRRAMRDGIHCRISQQDFGARFWYGTPDFQTAHLPGYDDPLICYDECFFNMELVDVLASFLLREDSKKLEMVLTSPDGSGHYNNRIPFKAVFNVVGFRMSRFRSLSKQQILDRFTAKFFLAKISSGGKDTWSNGEPKRNHAKFWMIDNLFYVGSENFYPSTVPPGVYGSIQEFGVIVENAGAARDMVRDKYFDAMMAKSKRGEVKLADLTWKD